MITSAQEIREIGMRVDQLIADGEGFLPPRDLQIISDILHGRLHMNEYSKQLYHECQCQKEECKCQR
jgi:hypothetical protein